MLPGKYPRNVPWSEYCQEHYGVAVASITISIVGGGLDFPKYYQKSATPAKKKKFSEICHKLQLIRWSYMYMYYDTTSVECTVQDDKL
eukprot:1503491-Prymnesium_polylepis.1